MQHSQQTSTNIFVHKALEIRQTKSMGLGYFAKQDIPTKTILINAAYEDLITYEAVIQHDFYKDILQNVGDKCLAMAYYLAAIEKIPQESQFCDLKVKKYLKDLPKNFDCLICWTQDQLNLLGCQKLKQETVKSKEEIVKQFEKIQQLMFLYPILKPNPMWLSEAQRNKEKQIQCSQNIKTKPNSLDDETGSVNSWNCSDDSDHEIFHFSQRNNTRAEQRQKQKIVYSQLAPKVQLSRVINLYASIKSRNFYYSTQHDTDSLVGAIVPSMDLFNHRKQSCCQYQQRGSFLLITATKDIVKDEQIFFNYGDFKLEVNLKKYGFVDTDQIAEQTGRKGIAQLYKKTKKRLQSCQNTQ